MKFQFNNKKLLGQIPLVIFYGVLLNFVLFFLVSVLLGGTAELGYVADGKYFLGDHGYYREVSKTVYFFSKTYTEFTKAVFPLAFVAFPFVLLNKNIRAIMRRKK